MPLNVLFAEVDDPRRPQARRHALEDILLIATLTVICGADSWPEVELFGRQKQAWLGNVPGPAARDSLRTTPSDADPQQPGGCLTRWVRSLAESLQDQVVSVDGKVARRSRDAVRGVPPLHLVSAWADEARLVLGQCRVDDKSNEITAIPELLEMLVLEGGIVTIDAMGCYTRIAQTLRDRGADYVLALKDNQPPWHEAVVETFAGCDYDFHKTVNKNHGRIETRRCWVIGTPAYIRYVGPRRALARPAQLGHDRGPAATGGPGHLGDPLLHFQPAGGCAAPVAGRAQPLGH